MEPLLSRWAASNGDLWAMDFRRLQAYLPASLERIDNLSEAHDHWLAKRLPKANGAVAVLPVHGALTKRGDRFSMGYDALERAFKAAIDSPKISGVVFDVDSPGGSSAGLPEFADAVFAARGSKPIIAVANTLAASAAYWAPSAADQFVMTPSADVGSIGVWSMHIDAHRFYEEMGLNITLISAGKYKVEGHPFAPLDDEAKAEYQRGVDETYAEFLSAVARNRGTKVSTVKSEFGEGRVLDAKRALAAGMVDRVATLSDVLQGIGARSTHEVDLESTAMLQAAFLGRPVEHQPVAYSEAARARREREHAAISC